jgi:hypothetical protein
MSTIVLGFDDKSISCTQAFQLENDKKNRATFYFSSSCEFPRPALQTLLQTFYRIVMVLGVGSGFGMFGI